ncbi:MAG: hypothetical protein VX433_01520 [Candidatus Thermoplasmatota archaeon]|nr:hypothetical protein [Candidatus Thermoplasmatota archaeon]
MLADIQSDINSEDYAPAWAAIIALTSHSDCRPIRESDALKILTTEALDTGLLWSMEQSDVQIVETIENIFDDEDQFGCIRMPTPWRNQLREYEGEGLDAELIPLRIMTELAFYELYTDYRKNGGFSYPLEDLRLTIGCSEQLWGSVIECLELWDADVIIQTGTIHRQGKPYTKNDAYFIGETLGDAKPSAWWCTK